MGRNQTGSAAVAHGLYINNTASVGIAQTVEFAVAAEEAGWDGVFLSDSFAYGFTDPWTQLAAIASRTEHITLGTWLTPIPRRQPWQVALDLAVVDQLSGGRVLLGAGLGTPMEYEALGESWEPKTLGEKYDEALEIITALWRGDEFSYAGDHYTIEDVTLPTVPVQEPRIPIVLGCWWPNRKPFQRAANWDGIMPYWPGILGDGAGPQGEQAPGSVEEQMREMLGYYHDLADDPGEIVLPRDPPTTPDGYVDLCLELGATWLLTTHYDQGPDFELDVERIRDGPPDV